jgi:beta-glucosidase
MNDHADPGREALMRSWIRHRDAGKRRAALAAAAALAALAGLAVAAPPSRAAQPSRAALAAMESAVPYANVPGTRLIALTPAKLAQCPWLDPRLPVGTRVRMVMAEMTLQDKVHLMEQGAGDGYVGRVPGQAALCIPAMTSQDDSSGVGDGLANVTQLPDPETLAAAWDPSLAYRYGQVNGIEHWEKGVDVTFGPTINIDRNPVWGRSFEVFGEDPYLTGQLAAAETEGIQSQGELAQDKHFAVYNQETNRNTRADDDIVSQEAMQEIYLPAFQAAADAGAASFMCAYSRPDGRFSCDNPYLEHDVLRSQFGSDAFVASDYGATHSTVDSVNAGMALEQGDGNAYFGHQQLVQAVEQHRVSMSTINTAITQILTQMFRFGLFNRQPTGTTSSVADTPAHAAFATEVAEQGTVLLKNAGHLLPFGPRTGSIAVIGTQAGPDPIQTAGGSAHVTAPVKTSPCAYIARDAPAGVTVSCDPSNDPATAATAAAAAATAVVFVQNYESEGSDLPTTLALPDGQNALIEAVARANPHTVVVINSGTPVVMPWLSSVQSVVFPGFPGQGDGPAIASVLYGRTDPGGHLTMTFPEDYAQTPAHSPAQFPGVNGKVEYSEGIFVGYRYYDEYHRTPLFPFGYGLSYTRFSFSRLRITPAAVPGAGQVRGPGQGPALATVRATVTNTGPVAGSEVAQLYVGDPAAAGQPPRQLEGFQRVTLAPGRSATVTFRLDARSLAYWDTRAGGWVVAPGRYQVYVGDSSARSDLPLRGSLRVRRSAGPQDVTVAAPARMTAPGSYTVPVTLANDSTVTDARARISLSVSTGGQAVPEASAAALVRVTGPRGTVPVLRPGQSVTRDFRLTLPPGLPPGSYQLRGTAGYLDQLGPGSATATALVTVPFPSLAAAANNAGITTSATAAQGNYDQVGDSFSASGLAAAGLAPGASLTADGARLTWPDAAPGEPDNTEPDGQTVRLSGSGGALVLAGSSYDGAYSAPVTIRYADGTVTRERFGFNDWYSNAPLPATSYEGTPVPAAALLATTASWNTAPDSPNLGKPHKVSVYVTMIPIRPGKPLASITFGFQQHLHVFAIGVSPASFSVTGPAVIRPGATANVTETLRDASRGASLSGVTLGLTAPPGLTVTAAGPVTFASVAPGQQVTAAWHVTAAASAAPGSYPLAAAARFGYRGSERALTAATAPDVPYPSLAAAYDNTGITSDTATSAGNFDGDGSSFSAQALAAAGLSPGAAVTAGGVRLTWPDAAPGTPDNIVASGQAIPLPGTGTRLAVLGAADYGAASGTATVVYADGSTQSFTLAFNDWYDNSALPGTSVVASVHWNHPSGPGTHLVSVYAASVTLRAGERPAYLVLPDISGAPAVNVTAMHVFTAAAGG